jgi:dipeptidyl aminopeptidase/acylaminoacyl peptidase
VLDPDSGSETVVTTAGDHALDRSWISVPREIEFAADDAATAYPLFYSPVNPDASAAPGDRPPLLVLAHGGPTGRVTEALDLNSSLGPAAASRSPP